MKSKCILVFGQRLYDLRTEEGLTQSELADDLLVHKHSISAYERGLNQPPFELLIAIAKYFHVSVDFLLGVTEERAPRDTDERYLYLPSCIKKKQMDAINYMISSVVFRCTHEK